MIIRMWQTLLHALLAMALGLHLAPLSAAPATFADAVAVGSSSSLTLTASFVAATEDVGQPLSLFLVAIVPSASGERLFARSSNAWLSVDPQAVPALATATASNASLLLPVVENMDVRELLGTRVYLGYGLGATAGTAFAEMLGARRYRLIHTVGNEWGDTGSAAPWALTPANATDLTAYFRLALGPAGQGYLYTTMSTAAATPAASAATTSDVSGAAAVSGTTLQEAGVDEADLIKSDGVFVFSLDPATQSEAWTAPRRDQLRRQRLDANAVAGALAAVDSLTLPFSADVSGSGLYLHEQQVVAIAQGGMQQGIYASWFAPLYWTQAVTEIALIDTASPTGMASRRHLRLDGALIGSRRVGSTLYLVLRSYPSVPGLDPWWSADKTASNQSLLEALQASAVLPRYAIDGGGAQALVDASACLIQKQNMAVSADIITLVGIDLAASDFRHAARCFTGGAEAFYMSEQSLYLATTRNSYGIEGSFPVYADQSSTDVHKFALNGLNISYRGSGNIAGHLGFDQNRKSFRLGEYQGALRVISQSDMRFGGWPTTTTDATPASPAQLSILQENAGTLTLVGRLPNAARPAPLGKPGEQLYATRLLGNRGYLVTFRLTDPLYILDLANPSDPRIAGELVVSGYSDYLFPLSANLLLGVGKDALVDGSAGDGRFAWYQGVKVSLIDVSDPAKPVEAARALIGRRGTDATALHDHHGIALQTLGNQVRVGLPVSVHETPSPYASGLASDYFQFTRTELQRFSIDLERKTLGIHVPLPSAETGQRAIDNDRALLWNEQAHYYQNGIWQSGLW